MTRAAGSHSGDNQLLAGLVTPIGAGGISIIQLAGSGATAVLDRFFHSPRKLPLATAQAGALLYGRLLRNDELLDEVIVEIGGTAARETLLINCHGGMVAARRILDALAEAGAREVVAAELPAFAEVFGALSAVQCEAAELLPRAPTLRVARMLLAQYHGAFEAAIASAGDALEREDNTGKAEAVISRLLATAVFGRRLFDPPRVVVAGRPNVGKSTLTNALLRFERVLVHSTPGTTRDAVEDVFAVDGVPFRLVDTAGIRQGESDVEREGVARGVSELALADLALFIFDGAVELQPEDETVLAETAPRTIIPVINKSDLPQRLAPDTLAQRLGAVPAFVSALRGTGIRQLEERILAAVYPALPADGEGVVFTERQSALLAQAAVALQANDSAQAVSLLRQI